jgi:pyridoxal phosphate enzyme (YggS family)
VILSGQEIAARRGEIERRIAQAASRRGRDPSAVTLLAVTKSHPADTVRLAASAGLTHFGENRVAEGAAKIEALRAEFPGLVWKLIGPLQTNKARPALQYFSVVESLDRERLAVRMEGLLALERRNLTVLLEVNMGGEETKSGVAPEAALDLAGSILVHPHLDLRGVMSVPPFAEDPEGSRPYFRRLVELRDRMADRFGRAFPEISMGMSHDFEIAVEEGATEVRIGTALFGPRGSA